MDNPHLTIKLPECEEIVLISILYNIQYKVFESIYTLNFCIFVLTSFGLPISLPFKSTAGSKYSSAVMLEELPTLLNSS